MTYSEAIELDDIPRAQAKREIQEFDPSQPNIWEEFKEDVGDKETYTGQEILDWLGY